MPRIRDIIELINNYWAIKASFNSKNWQTIVFCAHIDSWPLWTSLTNGHICLWNMKYPYLHGISLLFFSYSRNVLNLQCPLLAREMAYYMLEWQMVGEALLTEILISSTGNLTKTSTYLSIPMCTKNVGRRLWAKIGLKEASYSQGIKWKFPDSLSIHLPIRGET